VATARQREGSRSIEAARGASDRDGQGRLCRHAENATDGDLASPSDVRRDLAVSRRFERALPIPPPPRYFSINNKAACFPGFDQFN